MTDTGRWKLSGRTVAEIAFAAGRNRTAEAAEEVLDRLQVVTHSDAAALIAYDPVENTHRVLHSVGYDQAALEALGDHYIEIEPAEQMRRDKVPLRIDDLPYDWRTSDMFQEVMRPSGFDDGLSSMLYASDGAYAGMIHFSAERRRTFDEHNVEFLYAVASALGELANLRRQRSHVVVPEESVRATLFDGSGRLWPIDRFEPAIAPTHASFARFASVFLASPAPSICGVWPSQAGWLSLRVDRARDPIQQEGVGLMVVETPWSAPYGLSAREIDVLNGMAEGASNQRIASERAISVRTVTTHVERILAKLQQESRAGAAARASREGLLRLDTWGSP